MAAEFDISLDQVNWLGNIVSCVYLPTAILIPDTTGYSSPLYILFEVGCY